MIRSLAALALLAAAALPLAAQRGPVFSPDDIRIIAGFYGPGTGNLPPGLAKRGGNLPPGLQKQLVRNGQLPPGLQKKLTPFPPALNQQLPPLGAGYRRVLVDRWALLVADASNLILDTIDLSSAASSGGRGRRR
ncbi:MAG: hypothetical protein K2Q23_04000 [Bryobacteraceae bacterium]|nr:hypothetical protein [Bryobacteraceae bacterium]